MMGWKVRVVLSMEMVFVLSSTSGDQLCIHMIDFTDPVVSQVRVKVWFRIG